MIKNKHYIISIVILCIFIVFLLSKDETVKEVTKTVTKYDTITKVIDNTKPNKITKVTIKVTDTIKESDTITKIVYKNKEVNKYHYVDKFDNGIIESNIIADTIYKRDVKLITFNKTEETTIEKTKIKSALYFGGIINSDFNKSIRNVSVNAFYTHKNRFLITGGIGYEIEPNKPNISIGVAFKF